MRQILTSILVAVSALVAAGLSDRNTMAQVPGEDVYTPLVVGVLTPPTFPFLGTDQQYHIAYDLEIGNASRLPGALLRLEVVDAEDPSRVIAAFEGDALLQRTRTLSNQAVADQSIAPSEGRVVWVDFPLATQQDPPNAVFHRLTLLGASGPAAQSPTPLSYDVAPYDTSAGQPLVLAPPLKGKGWVALNGCCEPEYPHRTSFAPFNGSIVNGQMFAIDWKRMDDSGAFYGGDRTQNESYEDYGADVFAVANGTVVQVLDSLDPNEPGILPAQDPVRAAALTVQNVDGNNVVLDLGNGTYAFYGHLLKGSITVVVGDRVTEGQKLAELGNTGNSNASHLHFHLMDSPSVVGSHGLPYVLKSFEYDGQVPAEVLEAADDYLSGDFGTGRLPVPQPRTNQLPLALAVVNFPD